MRFLEKTIEKTFKFMEKLYFYIRNVDNLRLIATT